MRKFAFADASGRTPDNVQLKPGKYLANSGSNEDLMLKTLHSFGESAEVAALVSTEDPAKNHMKLFSIEQWSVDPNAKNGKVYMIVKEVEAPVVRLEQKIQFAIATLSNLTKDKAFKKWASDWMTNSDRDTASALAISESAKDEQEGIDSLLQMGISTGESHEEMQKQKAMLGRIAAVTKAAALATDASKSDDEVSKLLAEAIKDIQKFYKGENLVKLAEKICAE